MSERPNWRTSTYTTQDSCVEVADNGPHAVMVRDTKDRNRAVLSLTPVAWRAFVQHAKGQ
ncbi:MULTISPECIES: DUF397 domain-containing protein [unclassified Streptomyces]|uniref:DUF397 domain-containing protein n=1 Tax=unclassified Streptomyces TaxID=2593676 RepID=UPI00365448C3